MNPNARVPDRLKRTVQDWSQRPFGAQMAHLLRPATDDDLRRRRAHLFALLVVAVVSTAKHVTGLTDGDAQYTLYAVAIALGAAAGGVGPGLVAALTAMLLVGAEAPVGPFSIARALFAIEAVGVAVTVGGLSQRFRTTAIRLAAAEDANDALTRQASQARISLHAFEHLQQVAAESAVFVINAQGLIVEWPASAARMYGYAAEQVLGTSATSILGGSGRPAGIDDLLTTDGEGERIRRRGVHRRADGTPIHVDFTINKCGGHDHEHFTIGALDLSSRREAEAFREAALRAQAALEKSVDETRARFDTLEALTDPAISVAAGTATADELLERLRSAMRADGIALVQVGRTVTRVVAAAGLRPIAGAKPGGPAPGAAGDSRLVLVHNDPVRVAEVSVVVWPVTVSSIVVVPVRQAGTAAFRMEVVNERRAPATEWDLALARVVADRLASAMLLRRPSDSSDAVA